MSSGVGGDSLADFHRVKALFNALLELKPEEREAALAVSDADISTKSKVLVMLANSTAEADTLASAIGAVGRKSVV